MEIRAKEMLDVVADQVWMACQIFSSGRIYARTPPLQQKEAIHIDHCPDGHINQIGLSMISTVDSLCLSATFQSAIESIREIV
jgi:hypothetical protein